MVGGLGPGVKFGGKVWGKVTEKRENLGSSGTAIHKNWDIIPSMQEKTVHDNSQRSTTQILGSYLKFKRQNLGYLSSTSLEAKFGALTRISEANVGAKPPQLPNLEVLPLGWVR